MEYFLGGAFQPLSIIFLSRSIGNRMNDSAIRNLYN